MTRECSKIYYIRSPPLGREAIVVGDGRKLRLECVGSVDVVFHGQKYATLHVDVSYVPGLSINLYSLHTIQRTRVTILDASGIPIIEIGITFPRGVKGSCVQVSRLSPRSILHHHVPPFPQVPSLSWYVANVPGVPRVDLSCEINHGER